MLKHIKIHIRATTNKNTVKGNDGHDKVPRRGDLTFNMVHVGSDRFGFSTFDGTVLCDRARYSGMGIQTLCALAPSKLPELNEERDFTSNLELFFRNWKYTISSSQASMCRKIIRSLMLQDVRD